MNENIFGMNTFINNSLLFCFVSDLMLWEDRAELLYSVVCSICDTQNKANFPVNAIVTAGSIMLKCRNKHMSRWHHCLALMLDFGGAKNKTISAMNSCGLSVTPHTINEKKRHGSMA